MDFSKSCMRPITQAIPSPSPTKRNKNVIKNERKKFNRKAPIHNFSYLNHPQQRHKKTTTKKK